MTADQDTDASRQTRGVRRTGRSARVVEDVLGATFEELAVYGWGGLRIEGVAQRSGVNKTTIYRRWPTKRELVVAAILHAAPPADPVDLGDVQRDLIAMTERSVAWFSSERGRGLARMMLVERADPEVQALVQQLRTGYIDARRAVLRRAVDRGELPAEVDAELIVDLIHAYVFARIVKGGETVDDALVARVVDLVVAGARAAAVSRP